MSSAPPPEPAPHADTVAYGAGRLIPALPPGPYVIEPEDIDRFYVRVQEDGTIFFKGSRERIEAFLRACEKVGLELRVNHIAFCG
jgi:hypothetical protein